MRRIFGLSRILPLMACVEAGPGQPPVIDPMPPENACGADQLQGLVGQKASVLETMKFAGPVRVIKPGMAVTLDYSPMRLNIQLDAADNITAVTCG